MPPSPLLTPAPYRTQPALLAGELLDLVASRFFLRERAYFGLAWRDAAKYA